jgi:hypothetical protein
VTLRPGPSHVPPGSASRDVAQFSWWKSKMCNHIIGVDDEPWDIMEDGVSFDVDTEEIVVDKKSLIEAQMKI